MNRDEARRLACSDDDSFEAVALRLRAARVVAEVDPADSAITFWDPEPASDHVVAAEAGLVMPNSQLLEFYRRRLGLKSGFFEKGDLTSVGELVGDRLYEALKALNAPRKGR